MPSTYSTRLRLEDIGNGEQTGTWGDTADRNITVLLEEAVSGVAQVSMSDTNYTLTALNGTSDEARQMVIELTGTTTASRNVICPTAEKLYVVKNSTTGGFNIVFKTSGGTGITIASGKVRLLYCDGTNVVDAINDMPSGTQVGGSTVATLTGIETLTNKTLTAPALASPTFTGAVVVPDNIFTIADNGDATKKIAFEASGITTATTRTITVPDANLTLVGLTTTQSVTNKTFDNTNTHTVKDTLFTIQDNSDTTKQVQFECSGITTATTRTVTIPNSNGTILYTTGDGSSLTGIRTQGKETIWVPAGAMIASTTNGAASGTTESTTNKIMSKTMDFADGATVLHAQFEIRMPKSWNAGTITYAPVWTANSTSTNSVVWQLKAVALGDDETIDTAFGTAVNVTDANTSTALQVHLAAESSAITIGSTPASQNLIVFDIARDPTNGSDTLAATANLRGVNIYYTTSASNDT